ncbi:Fe-S cluster assembly protein HesB [Microbacterium fluvii]|uniref:Fe-S cluster assembly protein HesB n=1 Tax=Microbacterium fluvii TaxID=415215 RepID=A0ABW2HA38_9MICO|nr:Fe-S cluster assembly protein HesB [Microbacterium fluvii]MCU4671804.1 Fe-S cluster assembly protein HesB [Microbacterium fluvii]
MLTMTDTAAEAVKTIVARVPQAQDGGVRIRDTGPDTGFEISVAPAPEPDDVVIEGAGAKVFLDQVAATVLDERVLDAQLDDSGSVRFALANQG